MDPRPTDNVVLFDVMPREEAYRGVLDFGHGWELKLFLIRADGAGFGEEGVVAGVIRDSVLSIEERMSPEFEYGRFGYVLVHTGRRGICVTVTHFGAWGRTFEVFSSAWYTYGREFAGFALLDDVEPAMCWFESSRAMSEITSVCDLARTHSLVDIRRLYLAATPQTLSSAARHTSGLAP